MAFTNRSDILQFQFWEEEEFLSESWGIAVHDIDGNGYLDFYANHHSERSSEIIFNFASGTPHSVSFDPGGDLHSSTFFDIDQDGDVDILQGNGGRRGAAVDPTDQRTWNRVHLNTDGVLSEANSVGQFGLEYGPGSGRLLTPVNFDGQLAVFAGTFNRRPDGTYKGEFFARGDDGSYDPFAPVGDAVSGELAKGVHFGTDRFVDIINLDRFQRKLTVFENNGDGFGPGVSLATNATDVVTADFDGDLEQEILVGFSGRTESLFQRGANGGWTDVGASAIGNRPKKSWTILTAGDFDNDGDTDYVALQRGAGVDVFTYLNRGDGTFAVESRFQDVNIPGKSEYMISGDFNRDGALDLLISGSSGDGFTAGAYTLLEGEAPAENNWLSIELRGVASETGGLGARVYVTTADGKVRMLEQDSGAHFAAQNSTDLHFGLARNERADVRIVWPDGFSQVINGVAANQHVVLTEQRGPVYAQVLSGSNASERLTGSNLADMIRGEGGRDILSGRQGADALFGGDGADRMFGGAGADLLSGGPGKDVLSGGAGPDRFIFHTAADSPPGAARDVIRDFAVGTDILDVSRLDANTLRSGSQAFSFIADDAFDGRAGQLRYSGGLVQGDVNGDRVADFEVEIANLAALREQDIVL